MDPSTSHNPETEIEQPLTPEQKIIKELSESYPGDPLKPWWHAWGDRKTSWACAKPDCNAIIGRNELHDRKRHMMIHSTNRQFRCDVCSQSFVQQSNLKSHQRTHDKKNALLYCHLCLPGGAQCPFSYTDPSSFTRHKQGVHGAPKSDRPPRKASTSKSAKGKAPARKTGTRAMAKRRTRVASSEKKRRKGKEVARVEVEIEDEEEDEADAHEMSEGGAGPSKAGHGSYDGPSYPIVDPPDSPVSPDRPHHYPLRNARHHCHPSYRSKSRQPAQDHCTTPPSPRGSPGTGPSRWQEVQYTLPSPSRSLTPPTYWTKSAWEEGNDPDIELEDLDAFRGPVHQAAVGVCEYVLDGKVGGRGPYRSTFALDPYFSARLTHDVDWDV